MSALQKHALFFCFFLFALFFLNVQINAIDVGCAGACGGSYVCVVGSCNGGTCCTSYNTCTGLSCIAAGGWDCSSCTTANQCNNAGTTRTAGSWGSWGTCTGVCGPTGGTQNRTCDCGAENDCPTSCSGGGICGNSYSQVCCVSQAPQTQPAVTSVGTGTCSDYNPMTVNWSFNDTGTGACGASWGYTCGGNTDTFTIKVDGAPNTSGIASNLRTYVITTSAAVSHQVQVCAENGSGLENCSPAVTVTIDSSTPSVPVGSVSFSPDPVCIDKSIVHYSWSAVSDVGCAGLNSTPYWAQISDNSTTDGTGGFTSIIAGWEANNMWQNTLTEQSTQSYVPGRVMYTHVRSRDALDHQSAWSATGVVVVPSPTLYPAIHVDGPLIEDINRVCSPMSLLSSFTLEPVIVPAAGVTPICSMPTTSTYSCDFYLDNQKGNCVTRNIQVTMGGTYSGYGTIGWRSGAGGGQCSGNPISRSYSVGAAPDTNIPIYFAYNVVLPTSTPTPTPEGPTPTIEPTITPGGPTLTPSPTIAPSPTITPGGPTLTPTPTITPTPIAPTPPSAVGWFKLSQTSFNSRQQSRKNYVPYYIQKFDSEDSVANHNMMIGRSGIGSSGLLLQDTQLDPGANAYIAGVKTYSSNNWYTSGYTTTNDIDYSKYIEYIHARKDFKIISTLPLSFPTDGIYSVSADVTLDQSLFDGKHVVLVIEGNKTASFTTNFKPPNNGVVAVLASKIDIDPTVTSIDAILIGQTVVTGDSQNPLKITGNLIDEEAGGMSIGRSRSNGSYPSLFVVFDPKMYLDVLPYLSTSTYDWRQIQ